MWNIIDQLYLGDASHAADKELLANCNVTHILNCAATVPCFYPSDYEYLKLRVTPQALAGQIDIACRFIESGRKAGVTLVHCSEARERSPAIVLSYLCYCGWSIDDALRQLQESTKNRDRAFAPPGFAFMETILDRFD